MTLWDENANEESVYQIVGADEADIKKGLLSVAAPLARSLVGKRKGECVEVRTPSGTKSYEILSVRFTAPS